MNNIKFHKTKNGEKIKLTDLKTTHLENIIKWIKRKAKEGITVRVGGGTTADNIRHDEITYFGKEAKRQLNFSDYKSELKRRAIK